MVRAIDGADDPVEHAIHRLQVRGAHAVRGNRDIEGAALEMPRADPFRRPGIELDEEVALEILARIEMAVGPDDRIAVEAANVGGFGKLARRPGAERFARANPSGL